MKNFVILASALLLFTTAVAENHTVKFSVNPPLVCSNCENKVKENLRFEKGVKAVKPSAKKGEIEVTYDDSKTSIEGLQAGFKKIGYDASLIPVEICNDGNSSIQGVPCCNEAPEAACCKETPAAACCGAGK